MFANLAVIAVVLMGPGITGAETPGRSFNQGVEIRMAFDKTDIVVGEPVHLIISMTDVSALLKYGNVGAKFFYSEGNDVNISVQPPGELSYRYTATEDPGVYPSVEIDLGRGESMHYEMPVYFDQTQPNGYVFSKPGDYYLQARLSSYIMRDPAKVDTVTAPTRIHVRAPEGRVAQAFRIIGNPQCARALHLAFSPDAATAEKISKVAKDFSDTPYAPYCQYAAAMQLMEMPPPDYRAAALALQDFVKQHPDFPRIGAAIFNIAFAWDRAKEPGLAGDWFAFLRKRDPGFSLIRKENDIANRYYFGGISADVYSFWWLREKPWAFTIPKPRD